MVYAFEKKNFLNDAIVGAYTAVLNNLTVQNRNALFIPPTTSYGWEDDTPKKTLIHWESQQVIHVVKTLKFPRLLS